MGTAGSRSASLHSESDVSQEYRHATGFLTESALSRKLAYLDVERFAYIRYIGTIGALLLAIGGLGAGALPVVESPYASFPFGSIMARMLQTSTMLCFIGVALVVLAWLLMAPFTGALFRSDHRTTSLISMSMLRRTFMAWTLPFLATAPMFTQDIYSYIANGAIIDRGMDPYAGGPIDLLGSEDPLARSVPFIWAHSPSPYGPVSLGLAAAISNITNDSIALSVLLHRILSIAGLMLAGWALVHLARRCSVPPQAALWLGILNPLTILHLVAGIHNESILLGLLLAGVELGLRATDRIRNNLSDATTWGLIGLSGFLISCAGMVKVTGFIGLGFTGMALARAWYLKRHSPIEKMTLRSIAPPIISAALVSIAIMVLSIAVISLFTGIGLGWITGQGGAATIRSWMSLSTAVGVISGSIGGMLGLGDHTDAILTITRTVGILIAGAFMVRMLWATFKGAISPIGALGVATLILVLCFPVVHPWYALWAILPLAAWANRLIFRGTVTVYSVILSFFVLPRGLGLPPGTIASIYFGAALGFILLVAVLWFIRSKRQQARIQ